MKTLALFIGALAFALFFLSPKKEINSRTETQQKISLESTTEAPSSVPTPSIPQAFSQPTPFKAKIPLQPKNDDLVYIQGQIMHANDDGVVVVCEPNLPPPNLHALARREESEMGVICRRNYDAFHFGPLCILENSEWKHSKIFPKHYAEGKALLVNFPNRDVVKTGEFLQVVAVKTGDFHPVEKCDVYTVLFDHSGLRRE